MRFLFVHQNFPGQFRHVATELAADVRHQVVAFGDAARLKGRASMHPRLRTLGYPSDSAKAGQGTHHYVRDFEAAVRRGQAVARLAMKVREEGFVPDVVVAHPAWGEALFLRDVFPGARHVCYCEFYYHGEGADVGFDPEFPASLDSRLRARVRNATQLLTLAAADAGIAPTEWQRTRYPSEFQPKIRVLHEGIDTGVVRPDPEAALRLGSGTLTPADEVVTYVARNLEPYRGIHVLLRALPALLAARPRARVVIVGGDEVSYGQQLPAGETYRARYTREVGDRVDWSRVHFLGRIPYADFLTILQVSSAHVYLTYPFVLSWSMLEAMATGCLVVASATPPVREVIRHGENGLLVDFFDHAALADTVAQALTRPSEYRGLRAAARHTVVRRFDLRTRCLPDLIRFLTGTA
jgi:glycosyltransferase involved in cell wall biosynthesis